MTSLPLWTQPGFIACRVGDVLTDEQERALLPNGDGLLREIAARCSEAGKSEYVGGGSAQSVVPNEQELQAV